ncbi:MAG: class I tRNA ligase family protein, partial [Bacteroidales bacterium]|nr:class I tRNA ligase family protein [Bacteroidales bacterium]
TENLSNWYVRLNRKRYWGGEFNKDKLAAYQTLYSCLKTVALLASPIAPFFTEQLYRSLCMGKEKSVHLANFPQANASLIDKQLENRMDLAQRVSSLVLGLRRKVNIKVRQPLNKMLVPILDSRFKDYLEAVKDLILSEVNVKELEYLTDTAGILTKRIKPNFKTLGPRYGRSMKEISTAIAQFGQQDIARFEKDGKYELSLGKETIALQLEDVEITSEDIPGWQVATEGNLTVALDINVTPDLKNEGIARELVNRIQNLRKESGFEVTDKIRITFARHDEINQAVELHKAYIGSQTLASEIELVDHIDGNGKNIELDEETIVALKIERL